MLTSRPGHVWHGATTLPPNIDQCASATRLRNETDRYCSEWGHYGIHFFVRHKTVKGWKPHDGFPSTFDEFVRDSSTHNTQTKLLSGCQMYDPACRVDVASVARIVERVRNGCLRLLPSAPTRVHAGTFRCTPLQRKQAHESNALDYLLLTQLAKATQKTKVVQNS